MSRYRYDHNMIEPNATARHEANIVAVIALCDVKGSVAMIEYKQGNNLF
jgi:hypothetical protein